MTQANILNSGLWSERIGGEGNCSMESCGSQALVFLQTDCPHVFKPFLFSLWLKEPNITRDFLLIHPMEPQIINYENVTKMLLPSPKEVRKIMTIRNHLQTLILFFSILDMKFKSPSIVKHCVNHHILYIIFTI